MALKPTKELRAKYINQESEYSYVHKHDLDKVLEMLEQLQAELVAVKERVAALETKEAVKV
ncbi:hypothetical protein ES703_22100 [subsurface metagenome]